MNTSKQHPGFSQAVIALAVLAAFSPARAQDEPDIAQLTQPASSVSVGVGVASGDSKDRARFGLFNGLRDNSVNGLLGFDYLNNGDATGKWTIFEGRNLGLDNRELFFSQQQPGDWKYSLGYSELVRHDPRTINTGLIGAGTTTPTVVRLATPGTGSDVNLELKRKSYTLGLEKWFGGALNVEASFKSEDKDGARVFGRGFACSAAWVAAGSCASSTTQWALLLLPEPVNSTIKQVETKLNFNTGKLMLSGGYYGSFYTNANGTLTPTVPGTLNNPLGAPTAVDTGLRTTLGLPMALQPDNQAHQFYLSGNYRFTPTTKATFKYAYTHATQNDDFLSKGLTGAPAGVSNLGGEMNTTLVQGGLTARPVDKLSMLANVRYESKDNQTPIAYYNLEGTDRFTNGNPSPKKLAGKLEGSYQLPAGYRATLGGDYDEVDHGQFTSTDNIAGLTGIKQTTYELGWRAELRRAMSETLNGAISYGESRRHGSSWLQPRALPLTGVLPVTDAVIYNRTAIFPMIFENRTRNKWKLMGDWAPTERLSLQAFVEYGVDQYNGPTEHGLRDTGARFYSIDAAYTVINTWKLTGYLSHGDQVLHIGHSTGYDAELRNLTDSIGIGFSGKPSARLQMGGNLSYTQDINRYDQQADPLAAVTSSQILASGGGLPDVVYRLGRLNVFGQYVVQKNAYIRADFVHQRSYLKEWTWGNNGVPFAYSDNTTISAQQNQNVTFVGVSYVYKWQ